MVPDGTVVGRDWFGNGTLQGRRAAEFIFTAGSLNMLWKESAAEDGLKFQVHFDTFSLWCIWNVTIKHRTFSSVTDPAWCCWWSGDGQILLQGMAQGAGRLFLHREPHLTPRLGTLKSWKDFSVNLREWMRLKDAYSSWCEPGAF